MKVVHFGKEWKKGNNDKDKYLGQQKSLEELCILSNEKQKEKDLKILIRQLIKDVTCLGLQSEWS